MIRRPNPLGDLLRSRRRASKVGYKQLYAVTGMDRETLRKWETGDTYDVPLRGALLYARTVGITPDELIVAALGDAAMNGAGAEPAQEAARSEASDEAAVAGDARAASRQPRQKRRGSTRRPES